MRSLPLWLLLAAACGSTPAGTGPDASADGDPDADAAVPFGDAGAGPGRDGGPDAGADAAAPGIPDGFGNRFGMGLVSPGDALDWDLTADLAGPGGFVRVILAGLEPDSAGPDPAWVTAIDEVYARDLVPVVRIERPWGQMNYRDLSDDAEHLSYATLAAAHARVIAGLPRRDGWPLWVEVHNEPNLCTEWRCRPGSVAGDWLRYEQTAHEYASLLRDAADALHAIGDPRIKVANAGLAPGGAVDCQCGGDGFSPGVTSREFLREMIAEVPDLFDRIDGFASHSYPAEGEGWGFFVPYDRAAPGLHYYESELDLIGRDLPVLLTETGWTTSGGGSLEQIADWTVQAYGDPWLTDDAILAVMPFQLRDAAWDAFGWVTPDGSHRPVYDAVRALRCQTIAGRCP